MELPRALKLVWDASCGLMILLAVSTVGQAGIPAATAWASKLIMEGVLSAVSLARADWIKIGSALGFAGCVALASTLLGSVSHVAQEILRELLTLRVNRMIHEKALSLDLEFFETPEKQDMLQRATAEAGFRPLGALQGVFGLIQEVAVLLSIAVMLMRFSLWVLPVLAITGLPALYLQTRLARDSHGVQNRRAPEWRKLMYYNTLLTHNSHVKETKLFGLGNYLRGRYDELYRKFATENRSLLLRRSAGTAALDVLGMAGFYGAYVAVIAQAIGGHIGIGDLTLYSALLMQAPRTAQSLMHTVAMLYESGLYLANLSAFLSVRPRIPSGSGCGAPAPATLHEGVVFEHVSFRYPGAAHDVLSDVCLVVRPGEKVAIVGENGAGKTTLIKLLTRLYDPTAGRVTLNGTALPEYDLAALHSCVGVILQDFVRYGLTARENVGFGRVDMVDDLARIQTAARRGGAHDVIEQLPLGYESILGRWFTDPSSKSAVDLSAGQWQKVALARAFMRDALILVLDEPTSSLDAKAEYDIYQRFRTLAADRTVFLISHRFSTARMADRIIVLSAGRVVEEGTHDELLRLKGRYADLFGLQARGYR